MENARRVRIGIRRPDEEHMEVWLNGEQIGALNHDEHGWDGMRTAEALVLQIAAAVGVEVEEW